MQMLAFLTDLTLAYHHNFPTYVKRRFSPRKIHTFLSNRQSVSTKLLAAESSGIDPGDEQQEDNLENDLLSQIDEKYQKRIVGLEELVAKQEVEIHRLKSKCDELSTASEAFMRVISLLREAGLDDTKLQNNVPDEAPEKEESDPVSTTDLGRGFIESYDESMIFGEAPSSVIDAADAAGAAILAALLGGKQRMLVDVRDAELSNDPDTLVQFIELAILPVAAGLEGLESTRNRVKIVFPKVSQLLEYRRTMALAAPEVVALSTLGFDPVDERDKLVLIVAPEPDDEEGLLAIKELLSNDGEKEGMQKTPVVILNYHMVPVSLPEEFITAYHLRLLRVQYMSGGNANEYLTQFQNKEEPDQREDSEVSELVEEPSLDASESENDSEEVILEDEELEAAMKHAHEVGMNQGITRAMVIRAYPRPWHLFVDTSPGTDADFEVAGTFVQEPNMEELNFAIVECLEGSEREDEIVAKQMQQALEDGQLEKVSDMIGNVLGYDEDLSDEEGEDEDDENDLDS